ncbi:MAG TPA: TlpA family protein disulfide reductase, partial [Caulobacteraceae bacterium]|nr:TlpA family protein disulfide reductase [Caulobacteraceae bacterium]
TPPLQLYRDPAYRMAFGIEPRAEGFPTTLVIDRQGRERARLSGAADWSSPEARALVERLLREG